MIGRRVKTNAKGLLRDLSRPGDYGRINRTLAQVFGIEAQLYWNVIAPDGSSCKLAPAIHRVDEHPDGTITVYPSIVTSSWHGWLVGGVWSAA